MSHVWNNSKQKGSAKLMLLAIADNANDHGDAYPGIKKLAKKCSTTVRNAQKIIAKLEVDGELKVYSNLGTKTSSGWTNLFRVIMKGVNDTTPLTLPQGAQGVNGRTSHEVSPRSPHRVSPRSPKPSVEPSEESSKKKKKIFSSKSKRKKTPTADVPKAEGEQSVSSAADDTGTVLSLAEMEANKAEISAAIAELINKKCTSKREYPKYVRKTTQQA